MPDLSLQLPIVGQPIWTVSMACLLRELRRYLSDFKGFARMDLEGIRAVVANLHQTTSLSFSQLYLSSNRPNQFHYIIYLLPEIRWGKNVAFQHCGITIT